MIEQLSIDLSNRCGKRCPFCYNRSRPEGETLWQPDEVIAFATDCIEHGVRAVSLGGGEPFEYSGVFRVIEVLRQRCYLTVTTNGLPLADAAVWSRLCAVRPDKIHVTIHRPDAAAEVCRVLRLIGRLAEIGVKPGVNLLVGADNIAAARRAYLRASEVLSAGQIILVPQRYGNTPTAAQLVEVSGGRPFQSPSCLLACQPPGSFASVTYDKRASRCSFAGGKALLPSLTYEGLLAALSQASFIPCTERELA